MTDRIRSLTVILDKDYRDDDLQRVVQAIEMVKGVATVNQHVLTADDYMARSTAKFELRNKVRETLLALLREDD